MLNILFNIALLSSKILVLFGLDYRAGNSKFQRPKILALSVPLISSDYMEALAIHARIAGELKNCT